MAIESNFNYPSDLNASNPLGTDFRREGDNHIRGIKSVLKTTFPNITGAVTPTQAELNVLAGTGTAWGVVPQGCILMWSGTIAAIPSGYVLCDGLNNTPDLRDRFVVGAKQDDEGTAKSNIDGSLQQSGGSTGTTTASAGTHSHAVTVDAHTLTEAEMPSHGHAVRTNSSAGSSSPNNYPGYSASRDTYTHTSALGAADTGGGGSHSHTASSDSAGSHTHSVTVVQPYFALAYIMKS